MFEYSTRGAIIKKVSETSVMAALIFDRDFANNLLFKSKEMIVRMPNDLIYNSFYKSVNEY
ncbi:hypothetical protein V1478_004705 [Vespula squamosa]|uniref:Uncharacterized protein n=1 Tax=Vespula squamosa TaxID=30214 RepID=A0ABD2BGX8_VESSQ